MGSIPSTKPNCVSYGRVTTSKSYHLDPKDFSVSHPLFQQQGMRDIINLDSVNSSSPSPTLCLPFETGPGYTARAGLQLEIIPASARITGLRAYAMSKLKSDACIKNEGTS